MPAEVGSYATVVTTALALVPIATLRLEAAIVPASSDEDALGLARLAFRVLTAFGVLAAAVSSLLVVGHVEVSATVTQIDWLLLPALVVTYGLVAVLTQVSLRQRSYRKIAVRGIAQNLALLVGQAASSVVAAKSFGLLLADSFSRAVGALTFVPSWRRFKESVAIATPARVVFKGYRGIIAHYLPAGLIEGITAASYIWLLSYWYGASSAGSWALVVRFVALPIGLITYALGQALVSELSVTVKVKPNEAMSSFTRVLKALSVLAGLLFLLLFLVVPKVLPLILGSDWVQSAEMAREASFGLAVQFVWSPISSIFAVFHMWGRFLVVSIARVTTAFFTALVAHSLGADAAGLVGVMASADALVLIIGIIGTFRVARRRLP